MNILALAGVIVSVVIVTFFAGVFFGVLVLQPRTVIGRRQETSGRRDAHVEQVPATPPPLSLTTPALPAASVVYVVTGDQRAALLSASPDATALPALPAHPSEVQR